MGSRMVLCNVQLQCVQQIACDKSIVVLAKIAARVTVARFDEKVSTLLSVVHVCNLASANMFLCFCCHRLGRHSKDGVYPHAVFSPL